MQKYALQKISVASYMFDSWKEMYLHIQVNHSVIICHKTAMKKTKYNPEINQERYFLNLTYNSVKKHSASVLKKKVSSNKNRQSQDCGIVRLLQRHMKTTYLFSITSQKSETDPSLNT